MDSDTMISRTVTDFIGHTEQVFKNKITYFGLKSAKGLDNPHSIHLLDTKNRPASIFFFSETTMSNQAIGWVGQNIRKIVGNTLCQYHT